ncbi:MAG: hypothetical protein J6I46_00035 [Ruminococcus sp.]|nr:hypothetical protein [Ruminococcus sp.]
MGKIVTKLLLWVIGKVLGGGGINADDVRIEDNYLDLVDDLWDYFALVGIGFTLIYFLLEVNRKYAFESTDLTIKTFAVPFIKLVAAIVVLSNGEMIIHSLVDLGNTFIDYVGEGKGFTPTKDQADKLADTLNDVMGGASFMVALLLILPTIICWLLTVVCQLVWKYKALGYKIELLFRVGISPIALADIYSGQNSQAIKWCKGLLATVLYGASFIVIVKLGNALILADLNNKISEFAQYKSVENIWDMFNAMLTVSFSVPAE